MFSLRRRMENATGHEFWTFKKKPLYSWLVRLFLVAYVAHTCPCCCFFLYAGIHIIIYSPYKALYVHTINCYSQ